MTGVDAIGESAGGGKEGAGCAQYDAGQAQHMTQHSMLGATRIHTTLFHLSMNARAI